MKVLLITIIVVLLIIYYLQPEKKEVFTTKEISKKIDVPVEKSWNDVLQDKSLDPSISESHSDYIANTRQYSSGANYTAVSDDNTSDLFTNYLGFSKPRFVEIDPTATQIPDIDNSVFKRNKHMYFKNDYNL